MGEDAGCAMALGELLGPVLRKWPGRAAIVFISGLNLVVLLSYRSNHDPTYPLALAGVDALFVVLVLTHPLWLDRESALRPNEGTPHHHVGGGAE